MSNSVLKEALGSDRSMIEGSGIEGGSTIERVLVQDSHRSPIWLISVAVNTAAWCILPVSPLPDPYCRNSGAVYLPVISV